MSKQDRFGSHGGDAIGRAYAAGLLGEGNEAKRLLDTARKLNAAYWCEIPAPYTRCALDVRVPGSTEQSQERIDRIHRQNEWLNPRLRTLGKMGREYRKAVDELCIDFYPDHGPSWLDGVIWAMDHGKPIDPRHEAQLKRAIEGLTAIL